MSDANENVNQGQSLDDVIASADEAIKAVEKTIADEEKPAEATSATKETSPEATSDVAVEAEKAPASDTSGTVAPSRSASMKWCVLRVASNKEDMVRDTLERKVAIEGLDKVINRILVPTEKRPQQKGRGKQKMVARKMYPGYVFLEMMLEEDGSIDERAWFTIKETTGVGDFIGSGGKPSPMAPGDVEKMLMQVEKAKEGAPVSVEFEAGNTVKVKEGAFENFEGTVEEVLPDKGLVRVVVTIFGRSTPVELEYWQVEKV